MFITFAAVGVPVGVTRNPHASEVPVFFSPGDTRIVHYGPSYFCAGVTLVDKSNSTDSTVYLIKETPPLTDQNSFTIHSSINLADNVYNYWNYYLHPNSHFLTEICTRPNSADGTFYLIKGRSNFQRWITLLSANEALDFLSITNLPCSEGNIHRYSFLVETADEYYFVYYNNGSSTGRLFLQLIFTITINRFQYSTSDLDSVANCSAPTIGECSLNVPYGSDYRALIVTGIPNNPDWEENVEINLHCSDRAWAYAVVVLVPIFAICGCVTILISVCICWIQWDSIKECCSFRRSSLAVARTNTFDMFSKSQN